jgi:outer membrane protein assembly factor BamB
MKTSNTRRAANYLLIIALVLFLVFAGLAVYHRYFSTQLRFTGDESLQAELASATLLDDDEVAPDRRDWPQWRGIRRDGVAFEPHLLKQWPEDGPRQLWQVPDSQGLSSFVVRGDRCYTMLRQNNREIVVCLGSDSGQEIWHFEYEAKANFREGGSGPRSTPALDGDRLYTVGINGQLNCLDVQTGKSAWPHGHDLLQEFNASNLQWGVSFSPLIEGDLVVTTPGGPDGNAIVAFNKTTGELAWKSQSDPMSYSSPIAATIGGVRQIVVLAAKKALGVSAQDGSLLWSLDWTVDFDVNAATPLAFKAKSGDKILDYVFISSGYGKGCTLLKIAKGDNGFTARPVYVGNQMKSHFATPVRHGDYLYGFDETRLSCLAIKTGKITWSKSGFNKGSLLAVNDCLVVLGETGDLALIEANPQEAKEIARARPFPRRPQHAWTMPVLAEGKLFLRDENMLLCLELSEK